MIWIDVFQKLLILSVPINYIKMTIFLTYNIHTIEFYHCFSRFLDDMHTDKSLFFFHVAPWRLKKKTFVFTSHRPNLKE